MDLALAPLALFAVIAILIIAAILFLGRRR
jgi:hypothetical protein